MKRNLIIAGIVLVVAAVAVRAYVQFRPRPAAQRGDPAIAVAFSLGALERTSDHQLTKEQISALLPLLRVLRDTDPNDTEASRALAEQIRKTLTPEQIAALERMREEARARQQAGQGPRPGSPGPGRGPGFGPGGGPSGGPGGGPGQPTRSPAEIRQRVLTRVIALLESRSQ